MARETINRLLFSMPDRPGIIHELSGVLASEGCNISHAEQFSSPSGFFFLRFVFKGKAVSLRQKIEEVFPEAYVSLRDERKKKIAIFVSRQTHCLADLLWRERSGDLPVETALVISNHPEAEKECAGVPFYHRPQGKDREKGERDILEILPKDIDFIVLARYMRILSASFLQSAALPIINIHHSFLPAFPGAKPYQQAYERGVKVIGATAHFVVPELDAGPIISQGVKRVGHLESAEQLEKIGQDEERQVLNEAVLAFAEDRILLDGPRTVVFS